MTDQEQQLPQAPVYREPNHHIARVTVYDPPQIGFNPQDLTELGAQLATAGLTTLQVRAMVAKIQQIAAQAAVAMAPEILEEIRRIQEARILEVLQRVRLLPVYMGYVQRDRVLQIIQDVATRVPRQ